MIWRGRWKLVYQPLEGGHALRLFDLEVDPSCRHDVSEQYADVKADLWERLQGIIAADLPCARK